MNRWMAVAIVLFSAIFVYTARTQEQSADGCGDPVPQNDAQSGRFHVTWVKDAHGEAKAVKVPVKELLVARLNFAGQTALPVFQQEQIADSLTARDYDDDKEGLNELQSRIVDAWQQQGYFRARADLSNIEVIDESAGTRTVAVTATIQAGKQYQLDEIRFVDLSSDPGASSATAVTEGAKFSAAELRSRFLIQQGDIFDTHKMQEGLEQLRKAYGAKGFINMAVVPSMQMDEKANRITATLEIEEGKQFRIAKLEIVGYDRPPVRRLLSSLGIASGEIFDSSRFEEFERQVPSAALPDELRLGAAVRTINGERGTIDLTLRVDACPTR